MTTEKNQPEHFERRILLMVAGHSPAIITETLYALPANQKPTEIRIITTTSGKNILKEQLLGANNIIEQLCKAHEIPVPLFDESCIYVIAPKDGDELKDIQTEAENEITADFITTKVRELTQDNDCSLHVSIAGGRKTMTYYLGYALSVFGRIQDRMSHVLVEDRYAIQGFFYPTKESHILTNSRTGEKFDAKDVKVMLGQLPFIRLRDGLTDDLLNKQDLSYSDIIEIAQRQLNPLSVVVVAGNPPILRCGNKDIKLEIAEFAQYLWLLEQHCKDSSYRVSFRTLPKQQKYFTDFFSVYKRLSDESEHYTKAYNNGPKAFVKAFGERNSRIKSKLEKELGQPQAKQYLIQSESIEGSKVYFLPPTLKANDIEIQLHKP